MQSDDCGGSLEDGAEDVGSVTERYEEKFVQALENAQEKSIQTRLGALQAACEILMLRFMPDIVDDRKITLIDIIEKALRRGKGAEQANAAKLAPLLSIQLAGDDIIPKGLNQTLIITAQDNSVSYEARAKVSHLGQWIFDWIVQLDYFTIESKRRQNEWNEWKPHNLFC